jgi:hypothetical protein
MKLTEHYQLNKSAKVGETIKCPSCKTEFTKSNYQQAFCKTKRGTWCKDQYWNTVTPTKRNNRTRISPASARWTARQSDLRERNFNPDYWEHPFSSEGLGQWDY